ncbi:MAG: cytochrome biosis protein CcmI [Gammaproteobacteria bacterium]|nr:cytochrome biosis protein CcmI [Gammaproteobacteria bacterium]
MPLFWLLAALLIFTTLLCVAWPFLPRLARTNTLSEPPPKRILILLLIALPGLAIGLYLHWGSGKQWSLYYQQQKNSQVIDSTLQQFGSPQQVIEKLEAQLQTRPDAKGWYLLGRLYMSQSLFPQAVAAFANANELKPNDPQTILQYAEAQFLAQHSLSIQAKALIEKVLAQQPDNTEAANILAIAAYQQGDYQQAIDRWEQLLTRFPAQSEDGKKLLEAIARAQAGLKEMPQLAAKIQIPVRVKLAKELLKQLNPDDTVFIYAQAATGPKMPLAIIRKQVKDLPLTVTLDETMAMIPGMTLDKFNPIHLVARVSKSGQAQPQPGDWLGTSPTIDTANIPANLQIVINNRNSSVSKN